MSDPWKDRIWELHNTGQNWEALLILLLDIVDELGGIRKHIRPEWYE